MSHINAIHGKRHIVVCITHQHEKSHCYFDCIHSYVSVCVWCVHAYATSSSFFVVVAYSLFEHNKNRFYSSCFGYTSECVCVCVFFFVYLPSHDKTGLCVQELSQFFSHCKRLCWIIFITFMHVYFLLFSVFQFFAWFLPFHFLPKASRYETKNAVLIWLNAVKHNEHTRFVRNSLSFHRPR